MAFDAFISYSSKDKAAANGACAVLENNGVRCWIAPRDIRPGIEYGAAIIEAIDRCRVMILIFSSSANGSGQILREVERAVSKGVPIVPVRIEGVLPTKSMEYFLGTIHWLDALTPPLESHLRQLCDTVRAILASGAADVPPDPPARVATEPKMPAKSRAGVRLAVVVALAVVVITAIVGAMLIFRQPTAPPPSAVLVPAPAAQIEPLNPDTIPFIPDRDRMAVRTEYLPGPDHKAIAISSRLGFASGQPSEEMAKSAALAACQRVSEKDARKCELYAVGNRVVLTSGRPPLPPTPWVIRNPAVERPFAPEMVPLINAATRPAMQRYAAGPKAKAVAISTRGYAQFNGQDSVDEAIRRVLEFCGSFSNIPCLVVAVDDVFVVAIPTTMKPTGLFRPATEAAIAPEARGSVASRLANAGDGWNAVAVGSGGQPGVMLRAASEREALDGALAACGRLDHNCRIIAIGAFLVALPATAAP